jgi:tetratricopeptide (TPR) repeat protein
MVSDDTSGSQPESHRSADAGGDRRVILALTMVVVAILGAFVAYLTAKTEYETTVLERRLTQGQMLELEYRQSLLDRGAKRATFELRRAALAAEGKRNSELAEVLRTEDARRSQWLELQAQEEFMRARALQPFFNFLLNPFEGKLSIEESLTKRAAPRLQSIGFPVVWLNPNASAKNIADFSIWRQPMEKIEKNHEKLPHLALTVALFVLALFFFALADVFFERKRRTLILALLAISISFATIAYLMSLALEPWIKIAILATTFLTVALGLIGLRKGLPAWLSTSGEATHLSEPEPRGFAGTHLVSRHAHDNFSRFVVIAIAATVLLSAWAGYCYSDATTNMSRDVLKSFEQQVEMTKRSSRPNAEVLHWFDAFTSALEQRVGCAVSRQRETLAADGKLDAGPSELRAEKELRCKAVAAEDQRLVKVLDGSFGLEADRKFPEQFYFNVVHGDPLNNPIRAYALWDGYTELALFWGGKAISYLSVLTLCAIAVYFFGQALSIGTSRLGRILVYAGGSFVACSLIFIALASLENHRPAQPLPAECKIPDEPARESSADEISVQVAAYHYAKGKPLLDIARDTPDYQEAAKALECATKARPSFALAYTNLGSAYALARSPQSGQAYLSIQQKEKLREIVEIKRHAVESMQSLGYFVSPNTLNSYGASLWHLAVSYGDSAALKNSIVQYQRAIDAANFIRESLPEQPGTRSEPLDNAELLPRLNLGLAFLTQGKTQEALARFKLALDQGAAGDWELITTALTTFEVLDHNCANLYSAERCRQMKTEIREAKEELVKGAFDKPLSPSKATIRDATINVSPAIIGWRATLDNFVLGQDRLAVVWYVRDAPMPGASDPPIWRALPDIGGAVSADDLDDLGSGLRSATESFLLRSGHTQCLPAGDYRAEFYMNGNLALEKELTPTFKDFEAGRSREINVSACKPKTWKAWLGPEAGKWNPDLLRGYVTADGAPAAFFASYIAPDGLATDKSYFLQRILQSLQTYKFVTPQQANEWQTRVETCEGNPAPNAALLQKQWPSKDGLIYIGLVFPQTLPEGQACDLVRSIGNIIGPMNQ